MAIVVRAPCPADFADWEVLWRGYQEFYKADLGALTGWLWQNLLSPPANGPFCLLAEDETGRVCGLAHYLFHSTAWSREQRCYLNDLYTSPDMRGRGVGRALIEAVYLAADEHGAPQVYWLTQEFNAEARALYDKLATRTPFIKYAR